MNFRLTLTGRIWLGFTVHVFWFSVVWCLVRLTSSGMDNPLSGDSDWTVLTVRFRQQPDDQGLLSVQAIVGLLNDGAGFAVDHFRRDFFPSPSGQAMQKLRTFSRR